MEDTRNTRLHPHLSNVLEDIAYALSEAASVIATLDALEAEPGARDEHEVTIARAKQLLEHLDASRATLALLVLDTLAELEPELLDLGDGDARDAAAVGEPWGEVR